MLFLASRELSCLLCDQLNDFTLWLTEAVMTRSWLFGGPSIGSGSPNETCGERPSRGFHMSENRLHQTCRRESFDITLCVTLSARNT